MCAGGWEGVSEESQGHGMILIPIPARILTRTLTLLRWREVKEEKMEPFFFFNLLGGENQKLNCN